MVGRDAKTVFNQEVIFEREVRLPSQSGFISRPRNLGSHTRHTPSSSTPYTSLNVLFMVTLSDSPEAPSTTLCFSHVATCWYHLPQLVISLSILHRTPFH